MIQAPAECITLAKYATAKGSINWILNRETAQLPKRIAVVYNSQTVTAHTAGATAVQPMHRTAGDTTPLPQIKVAVLNSQHDKESTDDADTTDSNSAESVGTSSKSKRKGGRPPAATGRRVTLWKDQPLEVVQTLEQWTPLTTAATATATASAAASAAASTATASASGCWKPLARSALHAPLSLSAVSRGMQSVWYSCL
jgi:hypothetical protein